MPADTPASAVRLSVILVSRNDDHGVGMRDRMTACVHGLLDQAHRHGLAGELILVDWNPPPDRAPLASLFDWSRARSLDVRVLTVPPEVHGRRPWSDKMPIHVVSGWNAGIRRARGEFVLCISSDVLLSDELVRCLAVERLDPGAVYRIARTDVKSEVVRATSIEEQLRMCEQSVLGIAEPLENEFPRGLGIPDLFLSAPGDFCLMARERWASLKGYPEFEPAGPGVDILFAYLAERHGLREVVLRPPRFLYHIDHSRGWSNAKHLLERVLYDGLRLKRFVPRRVRRRISPILLRLFPRQKSRLEERGVPVLSFDQIEDYVIDLYKGNNRIPPNDDGWGLSGETLPEAWMNRGGPPA